MWMWMDGEDGLELSLKAYHLCGSDESQLIENLMKAIESLKRDKSLQVNSGP
jgi:hypothetical protein